MKPWTPSTQAAVKEALKSFGQLQEWFMQHTRQADHAHSELGEKLEKTAGWKELIDAGYNGLMASYRDELQETLELIRQEEEHE